MDIDQEAADAGDDQEPTQESPSRVLVAASEILPAVIHVLPQTRRPFFPGQAIPLVVGTEWEATLKAVADTEHHVLGLVLTRNKEGETPKTRDFHPMGTACRIHRVQRERDQLQVLMEGLQRFQIQDWLSARPPFTVRARYHPEVHQDPTHLSVWTMESMQYFCGKYPVAKIYGVRAKFELVEQGEERFYLHAVLRKPLDAGG